jgi:hypothetical protein
VPGWREFARQWAVGNLKVMDLAPDKQHEACAGGWQDPAFWQELLENPGTTKVVPADPDRRLVNKAEWIAEHFDTSGLPIGHGHANACPDFYGDPYQQRACFAFTDGPFRYVSLDTNPAEGLEMGNIDAPQFAWLEQQLIAASGTYFDEGGNPIANPDGDDKLIVVFTHHTLGSLNNRQTSNDPTSDAKHGDDLKQLLLRFPNVILHTNGHTHENRIYAHEDPAKGTAYWEVNTAAITDWPHQSRTIEIADNGDGTLSIYAVVFDAAVDPNPRDIDWIADDPSSETALAPGEASRDVNEDWLAAAGLEVAAYDTQQDIPGAYGAAADRNVELLLDAPFPLPSTPAAAERAASPTGTDGGKAPLFLGPLLAGTVLVTRRPRSSR